MSVNSETLRFIFTSYQSYFVYGGVIYLFRMLMSLTLPVYKIRVYLTQNLHRLLGDQMERIKIKLYSNMTLNHNEIQILGDLLWNLFLYLEIRFL